MMIRITQRDLDAWRPTWPCSTLTTGTVELDDRNGDLVDLNGHLMLASTLQTLDAYELDAYLESVMKRRAERERRAAEAEAWALYHG